MAEHNQHDEDYKLDELETMGHEFDEPSKSQQKTESVRSEAKGTDVRRNALIAVGIVILGLILYKIYGALFTGKTESTKATIPPVTQTATKTAPQAVIKTAPQPQPQVQNQPVIQPQPQAVASLNDLKQKIAGIEISQDRSKSELSSLSNQVTGINNSINNLNAQIAKLNQTVNDLSTQVAKQTVVINQLSVMKRPTHEKHIIRTTQPTNKYYVQAIIPGRAWLIGTNGSTLTIREGSRVPGLGAVKLIDSIQGRVIMSSGRVLKFSQADS